MQKLKTSLLTLLIGLLSSCTTVELDQYAMKLETIDTEEGLLINSETSVCLKRAYHFGLDFLGPLHDAVEVPLKECLNNKWIAYNPVEHGKGIKKLNSARLDFARCKTNIYKGDNDEKLNLGNVYDRYGSEFQLVQ